MPKPVRPFPLISYYWEPSIGFRWKGTRYGIRHYDGRVSVEMRQLTDEGERLWGQLDYEDYLPLEGLTAMGKHYELGDEN